MAFARSRSDAVKELDAALAEVREIIEAQRLFGEPDSLIRIVSAIRPPTSSSTRTRSADSPASAASAPPSSSSTPSDRARTGTAADAS